MLKKTSFVEKRNPTSPTITFKEEVFGLCGSNHSGMGVTNTDNRVHTSVGAPRRVTPSIPIVDTLKHFCSFTFTSRARSFDQHPEVLSGAQWYIPCKLGFVWEAFNQSLLKQTLIKQLIRLTKR